MMAASPSAPLTPKAKTLLSQHNVTSSSTPSSSSSGLLFDPRYLTNSIHRSITPKNPSSKVRPMIARKTLSLRRPLDQSLVDRLVHIPAPFTSSPKRRQHERQTLLSTSKSSTANTNAAPTIAVANTTRKLTPQHAKLDQGGKIILPVPDVPFPPSLHELCQTTSWPPGWTQESVIRQSGKLVGKADRYFITPDKTCKLRSLKEIERFIKALHQYNGNETLAKKHMKDFS
jgi:hypothetical protein